MGTAVQWMLLLLAIAWNEYWRSTNGIIRSPGGGELHRIQSFGLIGGVVLALLGIILCQQIQKQCNLWPFILYLIINPIFIGLMTPISVLP